jgi:hypothetical protein
VIVAKVKGLQDWIFYLVGGSQNGSWIGAGDVASNISGDIDVQYLRPHESDGRITGREVVYEQICDQYYVNFEPFSTSESAVGITGDWSALPRTPIEISPENEIYLTALAGWLVEQAPSQPIVNINRIWRVDLEGNGTEEVILNATRFAEPSGHDVEPRDYSVVLLRTVSGSGVSTIKLVGDYYSEAAQNQFPWTYTLEFIGDLNGDGRMEVVVGASRWEGSGVLVFDIDGENVQLIFSVGCFL